MISPDEAEDGYEMVEELGELIIKWSDKGKSATNILAVLMTCYNRTFAATNATKDLFDFVFSEHGRKLTWANIERIRKEKFETQH